MTLKELAELLTSAAGQGHNLVDDLAEQLTAATANQTETKAPAKRKASGQGA